MRDALDDWGTKDAEIPVSVQKIWCHFYIAKNRT